MKRGGRCRGRLILSSSRERGYSVLQDYNNTYQDKLQELKQKSFIISAFYQQNKNFKKSNNIKHCGTNLIFKSCPNGDHKHLVGANFCRERFCPMCAYRRQKKFYHSTLDIMNYIAALDIFHYTFLTLTVKNVKSYQLAAALQMLSKSWDKFMKRRKIKALVKGFIKAVEITYNKDTNEYHPHLHVVLVFDKEYYKSHYISHNSFMQTWKECIKATYDPFVFVEKIEDTAPAQSVTELVKYTCKWSDIINSEVLQVFSAALRGKRCISYGGICKEVKAKLKIEDIESNTANLNDTELRACPECGSELVYELAAWNFGANRYITQVLS